MANTPDAVLEQNTAFNKKSRWQLVVRRLAFASDRRSYSMLQRMVIAAALFSIPLIIMSVSDIWLSNHYGDADTWFYHGHFVDFFKKSINLDQINFDYYRTRLPYIIPGSFTYYMFGDSFSPIVFSTVIIYGTIITSFWYVLSRNTSLPAAFAGTALLACDLYFLRSIGWQYVDNGVIAYETLTFALITAAARPGNNAALFNGFAGCAAASMLFTHLGSAILGPVFVAYEYFLISRNGASGSVSRRLTRAAGAAIGGALLATLFYSVLNAAIYHVSPFFMILQQFSVAEKELDRNHITLLQSGVLRDGFWLTVHFSVLIASVAVLSRYVFLSIAVWRKRSTEIFFHIALAASLLIALLLEIVNIAYYLLRDGEYISFYLPLTYFSLTFLLFSGKTGWRSAVLIWILAIASAVLRLVYAKGSGLPFLPHLSMIELVALLALALVATRMAAKTRFAVPLAAVFVVLTLALPCPFTRDDNVAYTEQAIRQVAGGRLPHIYFDAHDPVGLPFLASVTGSFTERAWIQHGGAYPDMSLTENPTLTNFHTGDLVVVLSSTIGDIADIRPTVEKYLGAVSQANSVRLEKPGFFLWAYYFELAAPRNTAQALSQTP